LDSQHLQECKQPVVQKQVPMQELLPRRLQPMQALPLVALLPLALLPQVVHRPPQTQWPVLKQLLHVVAARKNTKHNVKLNAWHKEMHKVVVQLLNRKKPRLKISKLMLIR
jgi:hypothetical protein